MALLPFFAVPVLLFLSWNSQNTEPKKGRGTVEVSVRDRITNAAIPGANVHLDGGGIEIERTTDQAGLARFTSLPTPGAYTVTVERVSYSVAHHCAESGIDCSDAINVPDDSPVRANVTLVPGGSVSGKVLDSAGQPLAGALVIVLGGLKSNPDITAPVMSSLTDERGAYRIHSVPPGRYYIAAHRNDVLRPSDSPARRAHVLYYPGVLAGEQARIMTVSAGSELSGIDFTVSYEAGHDVLGAVTGGHGETAMVVVMQPPNTLPRWYSPIATSSVDSTGKFVLHALPQGTYYLIGMTISGSTLSRGYSELTVGNEDVQDVSLALESTGHLDGTIQVVSNGDTKTPSLSGLNVSLTPLDMVLEGAAQVNANVRGTSFELTGLYPGTYRVGFLNIPAGWSVDKLTYGDKEIPSNLIAYSLTSRSDLTVFLKQEVRIISGSVTLDGKAVKQRTVLLLREGMLIRTMKTDASGRYQFSGLPRGAYAVATFSDDEFEPYARVSQIPRWVSGASKVVIDGPGTVTVDLSPLSPIPDIRDAYPTSISMRGIPPR